ncbi:putative adenylyl-sulfate kinase [Gemmata obscuriglobus]|nr:adenylyl-sulfate kinase [Gemmata obscuriglobus]QEG26585.1 putative adenylyl-sulfate kinase [Gemmata obscuriglobus]
MANIVFHAGTVTREERAQLLKQTGATIWFTGLSGSGKSTLAMALEQVLIRHGHAAYTLDGDNVRLGLNAGPKILAETRGYGPEQADRFGLGFSAADREENVRRIGEVAKLFADAGLFALTSFISPFRKDRDAARRAHEQNRTGAVPFIEVYVNTRSRRASGATRKGCTSRPAPQLAPGRKAEFTGIDAPYEPPLAPELTFDASAQTTEQGVELVLKYLKDRGLLH